MINPSELQRIAETYGTPTYVYDADTIKQQFFNFQQHLSIPHLICYAVKANGNIAILQLLANLGSGFDIVSKGELIRCLRAGGNAKKIVYSGVAKTHDEIQYALQTGIKCFNVESLPELERIQHVAKSLDVIAPIALRINPDINVKTHPYIATGLKEHKFGIALEHADAIIKRVPAYPNIQLKGLACHMGSQFNETAPYQFALQRLLDLTKNITIEFINLGGGMGIHYKDELAMDIQQLCQLFNETLKNKNITLILEPGRCIVGAAGVLLTKVEYIKEQNGKRFAIVDAGMNDFLRPALYEAWHDIQPIQPRDIPHQVYDVVGPVCESSDFLGKQRKLAIQSGDILMVKDAGAYGQSMSSNYNSRPKCCEILWLDGKAHEITRRENINDLFSHEQLLHSKQPIRFCKMHGLSNDFVVIDNVTQSINLNKDIIKSMADRRTGIGCDQVLVIGNSNNADFSYTIYNADGSEAFHCGNGARCVARFIHEQGLSNKKTLSLSLKHQTISVEVKDDEHITVAMGKPVFLPDFQVKIDSHSMTIHSVTLGNPHAILIEEPKQTLDLLVLGKTLNEHKQFPEGVNVSIIQKIDQHRIQLVVYERGVGVTQACGSAASAAAAFVMHEKLAQSPIIVSMPGGQCEVTWPDVNQSIYLTGSATTVYSGIWYG